MLVVDLMHEFELGVWKAIFTHLIRILYAAAPGSCLVMELDRRYIVVSLLQAFLLTRLADFVWYLLLVEAQSADSVPMLLR
jgi:hypothetical protein